MSTLPMLASVGQTIPVGEDWAHQVKWDGIRALADVKRSGAVLSSRNGVDLTDRWPGLVAYKGRDLLVDGEAVVLTEDGRCDTTTLRRAGARPMFMVFDILRLDGKDLMRLPWRDRQDLLATLGLTGRWSLAPSYDDGAKLFAATEAAGLEGIVSKRRAAIYQAGRRSQDWLKFRH